MRNPKIKQFILLFGLLLPTVWSGANDILSFDGLSPIVIKEGILQGTPKGFSIQASIDGHTLTVAFTENLGQVSIEIATTTGAIVDCMSMLTPNGFQFFITNTGDYIVSFTLPNGDKYYGEFTVTD